MQRMEKYDFAFGRGRRGCIEKSIALLDIYKPIPAMFLNFEMQILSSEWKVRNGWFVRQEGFYVQLKKR